MFKKPQEMVEILCNKGFSEQWIANQANMSQGTIHKIKNGNVRNPRIDTAERLETLYFQLVKN